ncbi:MAG: helix-turn-helix transcriptional regulator [Kibdelosporangium sp.]
MGSAPEPNYHGRQLIRSLKELRELARFTQQEAGDRLNLTLQKLSRLENGQLPGYHELCAMLDLYGLPTAEWPPHLEKWELAKKPGWWRKFGLKDPRYVRMEHEASAKYEFQLGHLPTLLQTDRYTRDLMLRKAKLPSERTIATELAVRKIQQDRLHNGHRLRLHTMLHEPTLHQGVDRAQLVRLIDQAQLPTVTLQIVPHTGALHAGLYGSVILLSFDDPEEPDIAFTDSLLGLAQTQDVKVTATVRTTLDHLASTAMTPEQSLALLRAMAAQRR